MTALLSSLVCLKYLLEVVYTHQDPEDATNVLVENLDCTGSQ